MVNYRLYVFMCLNVSSFSDQTTQKDVHKYMETVQKERKQTEQTKFKWQNTN